MSDQQKEVCTRPPTCQGSCLKVKAFGAFLAGALCGDLARKAALKAAERAAQTVKSEELSKFIKGAPKLGCAAAFNAAADYMYSQGDSFTECHPEPTNP